MTETPKEANRDLACGFALGLDAAQLSARGWDWLVVEKEPGVVIAKKAGSGQPESVAKPRGRGRARQLVAVKLTQFEWGVVLAALEIARTSADERSWLSTLEYELGVLTDDIAGQLGIPSETGAAVAMAPASNGGQA